MKILNIKLYNILKYAQNLFIIVDLCEHRDK